MYLAEMISAQCPMPGDSLKSKSSDIDDGAGKVVDAVQTNDKTCHFLFIGQIDKAEANELVLNQLPQIEITIKALPYSFQEE